MKLPANKLKNPIEKLILHLKTLPPGTTYEEEEPEYHGGETGDLGTGYQMRINIVLGFDPKRC